MTGIELYVTLNTRMGTLVGEKVSAVFGTPEERTLMTTLTQAGIDAAEKMIKLIEEGITYEKWKAFMDGVNNVDGPLSYFENANGDMARLVADYQAADLREAYDVNIEEGIFTKEVIQRDIDSLKQRLEWASRMWALQDDATTEATGGEKGVDVRVITDADLANVTTGDVKAEEVITQQSVDRRIEP